MVVTWLKINTYFENFQVHWKFGTIACKAQLKESTGLWATESRQKKDSRWFRNPSRGKRNKKGLHQCVVVLGSWPMWPLCNCDSSAFLRLSSLTEAEKHDSVFFQIMFIFTAVSITPTNLCKNKKRRKHDVTDWKILCMKFKNRACYYGIRIVPTTHNTVKKNQRMYYVTLVSNVGLSSASGTGSSGNTD